MRTMGVLLVMVVGLGWSALAQVEPTRGTIKVDRQDGQWASAQGGAFGEPSNWVDQTVPSEAGFATFHVAAGSAQTPYVVTGGQALGSLTVGGGFPAFEGVLDVSEQKVFGTGRVNIGNGVVGDSGLTVRGSGRLISNQLGVGRWQAGDDTYLFVKSGGEVANASSMSIGSAFLAGDTILRVESGGKLSTEDLSMGFDSSQDCGTSEFDCDSITATGSNSQLTVTGQLTLARDGQVALKLEDDATLDIDNMLTVGVNSGSKGFVSAASQATLDIDGLLTLGNSGSGQLKIEGGADLDVTSTVSCAGTLGVDAGAMGDFEIKHAGSTAEFSSLCVGLGGRGNMFIHTAGNLSGGTMEIAQNPDSEGYVYIGYAPGSNDQPDLQAPGVLSASSVSLGPEGRAIMEFGGLGTTGNINGTLSIETRDPALVNSFPNRVKVEQGARLTMVNLLVEREGLFLVTEEGIAQTTAADIFGFLAGVTVADGNWTVIQTLTISGDASQLDVRGTGEVTANVIDITNATARLRGDGSINGDIDNPLGATIQTTLDVSPVKALRKGMGPALTIDGNLTQTGGAIEVAVAGATADERTVLQVLGDATIEDAKLRLAFAPGYAPTQGSRFAMVEVDGALTFFDGVLQYSGLEPGFAAELRVNGDGDLEVEALNDGVPYAADTVFREGFDGEFIDVVD